MGNQSVPWRQKFCFLVFLTASTFGECGNLSIVGYLFGIWKYSLKTVLLPFFDSSSHPTTGHCKRSDFKKKKSVCGCIALDNDMRPIARKRLQSWQQERLSTLLNRHRTMLEFGIVKKEALPPPLISSVPSLGGESDGRLGRACRHNSPNRRNKTNTPIDEASVPGLVNLGGNNTLWILLFHSFPLISPWVSTLIPVWQTAGRQSKFRLI